MEIQTRHVDVKSEWLTDDGFNDATTRWLQELILDSLCHNYEEFGEGDGGHGGFREQVSGFLTLGFEGRSIRVVFTPCTGEYRVWLDGLGHRHVKKAGLCELVRSAGRLCAEIEMGLV